jgi:hypothetical protein
VGWETAFSSGLLIRAGVALVNLAQNASSHRSLLPLPQTVEPFPYINTTVILNSLEHSDLFWQPTIPLDQTPLLFGQGVTGVRGRILHGV